MKKIISILFLLLPVFSYSQIEKENYKKVSLEFIKNYNESNYKAIFKMLDANMKVALPLEKTIDFFTNNNSVAGKIQKMEFYELKQTAHIYKTTFDKELLNVLISLDKNDKINGLSITRHIPKGLPELERNSTEMKLPFNEEWTVSWGGTKVEDNYHISHNNQKFAYDLVITKHGKTYKGDAKENKNYYVFGKEILAPCDAKVVKIITGVHDNIPGQFNPKQITGNTVILETENNEFILFAHFKKESIIVKKGQKIKQGDLLGLCGNSGNSSEPHLHLSLQNVKDMNLATGAKLFFKKIKVNGKIKENYLPIKNDKIQNIKL